MPAKKKGGSVRARARFALKRKLTPQKLSLLDEIDLGRGSHSYAQALDKQVCVMEAINLMMHGPERAFLAGQGDEPPCISGVIRDVMIGLNDNASSKKTRNQLKALAKDIVGTAPSEYRDREIRIPGTRKNDYQEQKKTVKVLVQLDEDPDYMFTEQLRQAIAHGYYFTVFDEDAVEEKTARDELRELNSKYSKLISSTTMKKRIDAVRMLIDPTETISKKTVKTVKDAYEKRMKQRASLAEAWDD